MEGSGRLSLRNRRHLKVMKKEPLNLNDANYRTVVWQKWKRMLLVAWTIWMQFQRYRMHMNMEMGTELVARQEHVELHKG